MEELRQLCERWLAVDAEPWTRKEVESWTHDLDGSPAEERLRGRLRFGTAGLRAAMGAGYDRMNSVTVMQATQGVAAHILEECRGQELRPVVVGYDGRHHSKEFAEVATAVLIYKRIPVIALDRPVPTPLVAFGVRFWKAQAGIMVTASHNPKQDNGYKLYWADGCQILSPRDKQIEQLIRSNENPWTSSYKDVLSDPSTAVLVLGDRTRTTREAYMAETTGGLRFACPHTAPVRIVYSAFHGVGGPFVSEIYERFGLQPFIPVVQQNEIDPDFPTVEFPNPEEGPGALALSFSTADEHGARLVLANDPDADRLAVAEKTEEGWTTFTGDEIAALLATWLWRNRASNTEPDQFAMVASTVSSKRLASMAKKEGFVFREALTGFKWLSHAALDLQDKEQKQVLLTYEEAIGFLCGTTVHDKDGVAAAAVLGQMAYSTYAAGQTLRWVLEDFHERYGWHVNYNGYWRSTDASTLPRLFDKLRKEGFPSTFSSHATGRRYAVTSVRDLTMGTDTAEPSGHSVLPGDRKSEFLTFRIQSGIFGAEGDEPDTVLSLRGSGTEPKIKYYSELRCPDGSRAVSGEARAVLVDIVDAATEYCLNPCDNGLVRPGT